MIILLSFESPLQSEPSMQLNARQSEHFAELRRDPLYLRCLQRSDFYRRNDWLAICSFAIDADAAAIQFLKPGQFDDARDWQLLVRKALVSNGAAIRWLDPGDFAGDQTWRAVCRLAVCKDASVIRHIPSLTLSLAQQLAASYPEVIQYMQDADCLTWLTEALSSTRRDPLYDAAKVYPCLNQALKTLIKGALMFATCSMQQGNDECAGAVLKHGFAIPKIVWTRAWAALK